MEKGLKLVIRVLLFSCLFGVGVVAFHPDYRELFHMIRKGTPAESAIWQSNLDYYPAVGPTHEEKESRAK